MGFKYISAVNNDSELNGDLFFATRVMDNHYDAFVPMDAYHILTKKVIDDTAKIVKENKIIERKRAEINSCLDKIMYKANNLKDRGHESAYLAARKLHDNINEKVELFTKIESPNAEQVEEFSNFCTDQIKTAHKELDKHRGWNHILGNLALAIIGLGVLYAAAIVINKATTGNYLFFSKTDSAKLVDDLDSALKPLNKPKMQ